MTKQHGNMGRKSHKVQDIHQDQHLSDLPDQLPDDQPTRPFVDPQKPNKSSKPGPKDTK